MRRIRLIPTAASLMLATAAGAGAQWQLTGDVGASHLQQTGIPTGSAATAGITFDATAARAFVHSSILAARATQDRWTGQALLTGTVVGSSPTAPRWQLDGVASAFGQSNALPTASGELAARLRAGAVSRGVAIGAAAGMITHAGSSSQSWRGLADGWLTTGLERFFASAALTSAPVLGVTPPSAPIPRVRYLDLIAGWRHDVAGLSVGAAAGYRNGMGEVDDGSWASADASVWLTRRAALVLAAGTALPDVVRGTPRSTYVSAALRLSARPQTTLSLGKSSVAGPRVILSQSGGSASRLDIVAPNASRIELRADFTDWQPVLLEHTGPVFRLDTPLSPGLHRIAIRVDGGEWIAPANLPHADDGLGGTVGLITVP